jgi:hypothetical protein
MTILLLDVMLKFGSALLYYLAFYYFIPWGVKTLPFGLVIAGALSAIYFGCSHNFIYYVFLLLVGV